MAFDYEEVARREVDDGITTTCGYNCGCKDGKCQITPAGHKIDDHGNVVKVTPSPEWQEKMNRTLAGRKV